MCQSANVRYHILSAPVSSDLTLSRKFSTTQLPSGTEKNTAFATRSDAAARDTLTILAEAEEIGVATTIRRGRASLG